MISQKTTLPPKSSTTLAVEIQVKAGTIASSPGPKPDAARERCNPLVQEVTAIECAAFVKLDHLSSNSFTFGPCTSHPDLRGSKTELISEFKRFVLEIGIFNIVQVCGLLSSQSIFEDLFSDHTCK